MKGVIDFFRGLLSIGRLRKEVDELTEETDKGMERNANRVAYLEGKLDGTLDAIHKLGLRE